MSASLLAWPDISPDILITNRDDHPNGPIDFDRFGKMVGDSVPTVVQSESLNPDLFVEGGSASVGHVQGQGAGVDG